jgi:aminoglycoside 6-adenylyltransferase
MRMRSESEMLELILSTARCDERIRAVILNGSRANPNSPRDIFQDFDIVYIVTDTAHYNHNMDWIRRFGELMILQMPEEMDDPPPQREGAVVYLMQFMDGNRIDLGIYSLAQVEDQKKDSLSVVLLDKDGLFDGLPPASETIYLPKPPSAKAFSDCCNEFWWVCPYVAKGLWRGEFLYARYMMDHFIRDQLMKMLVWHMGVKTGFRKNPGKFGKYFQQYLDPDLWDVLLRTYPDARVENVWDALFTMGSLFRRVAFQLADRYGFVYPLEDDQRVSSYLAQIRDLPKEAAAMVSGQLQDPDVVISG